MEQIFEEQNFSEDKLHEECGVFGIFSHNEDVALNTYWGLYALQHRGQESTGIVVTDGERMKIKKGMGLVADHAHIAQWAACSGIDDLVETPVGTGQYAGVDPRAQLAELLGFTVEQDGAR